MQFFSKACQFLGANYIRKWSRGRTRESKSGGKNERSIIPSLKDVRAFLCLVAIIENLFQISEKQQSLCTVN